MATTTTEPVSPAAEYETYYGPAIFRPLAEHTIARAAPRRGERVLDLACGTGIVARTIAQHVGPGGHVVGIDINPAMVREARALARAEDIALDVQCADAATVDLPPSSFDLVVCQQGLQFLPDRAAGVATMRRALRPGGRVVIAVWRDLTHHPLYAALFEAELPHLLAVGADVTRADLVRPFSLGDVGELGGLLERGGFEQVQVEGVSIEARFTTPERFVERMERAYAAVVPALAEDPDAFDRYLRAISAATRDVVAAHQRGSHVVTPMHAHVATARAGAGLSGGT